MQTTVSPPSAMKPTQISWVLAADNPETLSRFYATVLGRPAVRGLSSQHWMLQSEDGARLEIYRPSRSRAFPDRGSALATCLRLEPALDPMQTLQTRLPALLSAGAVVRDAPRREAFGAEVWLHDPEGNALLIVVPKAAGASIDGH